MDSLPTVTATTTVTVEKIVTAVTAAPVVARQLTQYSIDDVVRNLFSIQQSMNVHATLARSIASAVTDGASVIRSQIASGRTNPYNTATVSTAKENSIFVILIVLLVVVIISALALLITLCVVAARLKNRSHTALAGNDKSYGAVGNGHVVPHHNTAAPVTATDSTFGQPATVGQPATFGQSANSSQPATFGQQTTYGQNDTHGYGGQHNNYPVLDQHTHHTPLHQDNTHHTPLHHDNNLTTHNPTVHTVQ